MDSPLGCFFLTNINFSKKGKSCISGLSLLVNHRKLGFHKMKFVMSEETFAGILLTISLNYKIFLKFFFIIFCKVCLSSQLDGSDINDSHFCKETAHDFCGFWILPLYGIRRSCFNF